MRQASRGEEYESKCGVRSDQTAGHAMIPREELRNLVHELSQPLSGISINTALIRDLLASSTADNPQLAHLLQNVDRDVGKTRQLLAKSRTLLAPTQEIEPPADRYRGKAAPEKNE